MFTQRTGKFKQYINISKHKFGAAEFSPKDRFTQHTYLWNKDDFRNIYYQ